MRSTGLDAQSHSKAILLAREAHREPRSPRTGETPEQILNRLAVRLNCEPRQVADRVIRMLEERQNARQTT